MSNNFKTTTRSARAGNIIKRLSVSLLDPGEDLIDWYDVAGVGMDLVGEEQSMTRSNEALADEFSGYVRRVSPIVADFTGLEMKAGSIATVVFNRKEWIAITTENLKPMLEVLLKGFIGSHSSVGEKQDLNRFVKMGLAGELGLTIGYLATRVLGQYDLAMMSGSDRPGQLYFIYPNILETEKRIGFDPTSFRLWLALHEVTHGFEFEANSWIKKYIEELIREYSQHMEARLERTSQWLGDDELGDDPLLKIASLRSISWLMSPDENPVLAKTQAIMSVLEGYSEYVMAKAGADIISDRQGIAMLMDHARANRNWIHKLVEKVIGLEIKMQQYRHGYAFIQNAADVGGMSLVNRVWEGPAAMPTLSELREPQLWITRMLRKSG
ncbi:MAG TPA: hypothetical protein ENI11_04925 [Actinobacteria bacterium]|nr:hypothetical protein [Actinomycetota bacterium]